MSQFSERKISGFFDSFVETFFTSVESHRESIASFNIKVTRKGGDNRLFINQSSKFYNYIFLFVGLTTVETLNFDWLIQDIITKQGGRGQRAVYYTCPQSFIITFYYSLAQQLWGLGLTQDIITKQGGGRHFCYLLRQSPKFNNILFVGSTTVGTWILMDDLLS